MILIINICREKLHYFEFVKPIEDLVDNHITKHYKDISNKDIENTDKIIICGTSLKDNKFLGDVNKFEWIKDYNKPVLGICGGMQIISIIFGGEVKTKKEIGYYFEEFKGFLGLKGKKEIYHLHNNYVALPNEFSEFTNSKIPQAVKHNKKEIYGALFHPEVRNKEVILNFLKLN